MKTIAQCAAEMTPEVVEAVFKFYSNPNKTLNDTLHEFRQFSEHTLRAMLKRDGEFEKAEYNRLYQGVPRKELNGVRGKFFKKTKPNGQRKKEDAADAFERRNKILTTAFRAKLAYDHSLAECKKAGLDEKTVEAFFSLVGEDDFNAQ